VRSYWSKGLHSPITRLIALRVLRIRIMGGSRILATIRRCSADRFSCTLADNTMPRNQGEVLNLMENLAGMHSCLEPKTQASPVAAGGKRRQPRAHENTGIGADEPEA
jgi:hypothetical protein